MSILGINISRRTFYVLIGIAFYLILLVVLTSVERNSQVSNIDSFQDSLWYSIVTLTTVGYGDIAPLTPIGQAISALIMLIGYSIIAVPTGIITTELTFSKVDSENKAVCAVCDKDDLIKNSLYCRHCGAKIDQ